MTAPHNNRRSFSRHLAGALPAHGWRTRFAPAPTGYLHLGHLVNAMHVWGIARAHGGLVVLRIEDHDRTRCRAEYETALLEDLEWLGFEADIAPGPSFAARPHPQRQSDQDARYAQALARLHADGVVFACQCTRREIAANAPRAAGEELRYPGTCRSADISVRTTFARRVRIDAGDERFDDLRLGPMVQRPSEQCGDLLARDRHANWTYQFAVVVDDIAHGIDVIIRGDDLLASTGRQQRLRRLLGHGPVPHTLHHALLRHPDGTKLSKANGDTALRERRRDGASPQLLLGEAAYRVGLQDTPRSLNVHDLADLFRETS